MKFVGLFENLNEGLNNLISDQTEMPQDGLKTALNEQQRATFNALYTITFSRCLRSQKKCEANCT